MYDYKVIVIANISAYLSAGTSTYYNLYNIQWQKVKDSLQ